MAFQLACFWLGILLYGSLIRLILARLKLKPATTYVVVALAVVVLNAPFQVLVSRIGIAFWPTLKILRPQDWYLQGLVTAEPVVLGFTWLIRARLRQRRLAREAGEAPPSAHGLLGAAPAQVLCLQMEDHYVRVHTQGGSRLVLATLGQAMAGLDKARGLQVHRSWWVAEQAVVRAAPDGRNLRLELSNGVTAPVARSSVAAVRAAGWIS